MQKLLHKSLQNAVYGEHQGQNVYIKVLDKILLNMVKIVLFMELSADTIYRASGICDQFTSQEHNYPSPHSLNTVTFPTSHRFGVPSITNYYKVLQDVEVEEHGIVKNPKCFGYGQFYSHVLYFSYLSYYSKHVKKSDILVQT